VKWTKLKDKTRDARTRFHQVLSIRFDCIHDDRVKHALHGSQTVSDLMTNDTHQGSHITKWKSMFKEIRNELTLETQTLGDECTVKVKYNND